MLSRNRNLKSEQAGKFSAVIARAVIRILIALRSFVSQDSKIINKKGYVCETGTSTASSSKVKKRDRLSLTSVQKLSR